MRQRLDLSKADGARRALEAVGAPGCLGQVAAREYATGVIELGENGPDGFEMVLVLDLEDLQQALAERGQTAYLSMVWSSWLPSALRFDTAC